MVGFSRADTESYNTRFGLRDCFGINLLETKLIIKDEEIYLPEIISKGDTFGIGLVYEDKYDYKLFITLNGKKLDLTDNKYNFY